MPQTNEWTLMFYFASDNPLAPGIVSHLKALKNAGYHHKTNVIGYFDPQTPGTPTHTFDVNAIEKLDDDNDKIGYIGFTPNDSYVKNLMKDKLWGDELSRDGKTKIRDRMVFQLSAKAKAKFNLPMPPRYKDGLAQTAVPDLAESAPAEEPKDDSKDEGHGPQKSLRAFLDFCVDKYPASALCSLYWVTV